MGEPQTIGGVAGAQLEAIVQRIERLEEEKKAIADDIKDVYAEAKANGFAAEPCLRVTVTPIADLDAVAAPLFEGRAA